MSESAERTVSAVDARRLWLALVVLVTVAIAPALVGGWVYDDHALPVQPLYARWSDVALAFVRSSDDYFRAIRPDEPLASGGQTWRPVPNALFAAVNASVGPSALAHHLVSLSAHWLALLALVWWAARDGLVRRAHAIVIAVFALHPALIEAYAYINGRSDAMAGAALLAGALALKRQRWWGWFAALLVAVASKETSIVASFFIVLAFAKGERAMRPAWLAWIVAIAVGIGARAAVSGSSATIRTDASLVELCGAWLRWIAIATESLLFPSVRAMRLLAWELSAPWTARALLALVATGALLAMCRGWVSRVLVVGAIATASPAIAVANAFWMGSDRYLYQPAALLALVALSMSEERARSVERKVTPLLAGVALFVLVTLTAISSLSYRSERWFAARMRDARPDDPTGYIVGAREAIVANDRDEARSLLAATERQRAVAPQAHRIIMLAISLGDLVLAERAIRAQQARGAINARLTADLFDLRARQGRWQDAARAASALLDGAGGERARRVRVLRAIARSWPPATQREAEVRGVIQVLR